MLGIKTQGLFHFPDKIIKSIQLVIGGPQIEMEIGIRGILLNAPFKLIRS